MNPQRSTGVHLVFALFIFLATGGSLLSQGFPAPPVITRQPSNDTVCIGGTAVFSVSATTFPYFEWFVEMNDGTSKNLSDDDIHSGTKSATLTVTGVTANMNGNRYRCVAIGRGYVSSQSAKLVINAGWTGIVSSNWGDARNWRCGVLPAATSDVLIKAGTPFMPVLNTRGTCRDLTIAAGASLTMSSNQVLQISGNMANQGTFNGSATGCLINYISSAAQSIGAGTYNNLTIYNGGLNNLSGNITINGTLSISSGSILTGNALLTLGSTAAIIAADAGNFIITNGGPGSGVRKMSVGPGNNGGEFVFPIGASQGSYTPVQLINAGTSDNFTARVTNGVYAAYNNELPVGTPIASGAVNKTWFVSEEVPGGSDVSLLVEWHGTDELPSFDRNRLTLSHYTNGQWLPMPRTAATGSNPYMLSRSGMTSFSPFAVGNENTALPVTFSAIGAVLKNNAVVVSWTTAHEVRNDHFDVELSQDGKNFHKVTTIQSKAPGGNSNLPLTYQTTIGLAKESATLGLGILSLLAFVAGAQRRKWMGWATMLALVLAVGYGCAKSNKEIDLNQRNIYVRIAQVDKDGIKRFSKIVVPKQ